MKIQPGPGLIAVEFLDDEETTDHGYGGPQAPSQHACAAECVGVGKKVDACRDGDVVFVRESARAYAIELDESTCLVNNFDVVGVLKKPA